MSDEPSGQPEQLQEPAPLILTPPEGQEQFVSEPRIEPRTEATEPDKGTKLFVLFFFLVVPPLGVALLAVVTWTLFKKLMAT